MSENSEKPAETTKKGLFDAAKLNEPAAEQKLDAFDDLLDPMEEAQLLELRSAIQARLPMTLNDLDLQAELILQYKTAQGLLNRVYNDASTPANQKAQVANSCSATLQQLGRMQLDMYTAERLKSIEQMLVRAVRTLPESAQRQFFVEYERLSNSLPQGEPQDVHA